MLHNISVSRKDQCILSILWFGCRHSLQLIAEPTLFWFLPPSVSCCFCRPRSFFPPLRNQAMRKKLILYFKRRNHARKQWVSPELGILAPPPECSPCPVTSVERVPAATQKSAAILERRNRNASSSFTRPNLELDFRIGRDFGSSRSEKHKMIEVKKLLFCDT